MERTARAALAARDGGSIQPGTSAGLVPHAAGLMKVIEFECGGHRFGVPLGCARRAVMAAQTAPLPGASDIVLGVLNVAGETVTVLDFARRAGVGATVITPAQQVLIIDLGGLLAGLVVDRILGVAERARPGADDAQGHPGAAGFVDAIVRLDDGLCLVLDPEKFLSEAEHGQLAEALNGAGHEHA